MYEQFFGLEDEPFRLTPDPHYLFLSTKHAEALAHLRLGLTESSGFVCITGDVGTGKTTLLRTFLSELGPHVAAAYVFVPPLSAHELVRRICREFGVPAAGQSPSDLVDELHAYLIAQHQAGRLCVVVLDEAQALSIELLEQVRLLLNLETETYKLLRIVLVGQPQLGKLLLNPDLAQLNQRITLRWHLGPLSYREMVAYIRHRLTVASGGRVAPLFTHPALRLLYSVSGGVPRLINMIAHRSLLAAFVARESKVSRTFVARAYREIQAVPLPGTLSRQRKAAFAALGLAIGVALVAFGAVPLNQLLSRRGQNIDSPIRTAHGTGVAAEPDVSVPYQAEVQAESRIPLPDQERDQREAVPANPPNVQAVKSSNPDVPPPGAADVARAESPPTPALAAVSPSATEPQAVRISSAGDLARMLADIDETTSIHAATDVVLGAWGAEPLSAAESPPSNLPLASFLTRRADFDVESIAWRRGLQDVSLTGNRSMLRLLDLPALITLRVPGGKGFRATAVIRLDRSRALLSIAKTPVIVDADLFETLWSGQAHVMWRDFDGLGASLRQGTRGMNVLRLQQLLARVGMLPGKPTGEFDTATLNAVLNFQHSRQLDADGVVGPLTRIVLYVAVGGYQRPTLNSHPDGLRSRKAPETAPPYAAS